MAAMIDRWRPTRWVSVVSAMLVFVVAGLLPVDGSAASRWKSSVDDSLDATLVFVDRSGDNAESGPVLEVSPGFSLNRAGARASADINYKLNLAVGGGDTDPTGISHDLTARGEFEAVEDLLYIEADAGARLVGNSPTTGRVDAINNRNESSQSYSVKVSPSLRPRTNNRYVRFESNNSIDLVDYSGGDNTNTDASNESVLNATLLSGPVFTTFDWDLRATQRNTSFEDRDDERREYSAGLGYRIDSRWRLTGRVGYEENDVDTVRTDTDGATWNVGGVWTPNTRTSLLVDYGNRYFGDTYSVRFNHRTRRTTLSVDAVREVSNRRASRLVDSFFVLVDADGVPIQDPISGDLVTINIPQLEQDDEDFLNTELRGAISVIGLRTSVSLFVDLAQREYEISGNDEDAYGAGFRVSRRMGQGITSSLSATYDRVERSNDSDSDTYDVALKLSKALSTKTSVALDLLHRERDSGGTNDFTENRIGISVSTSFL
jgi:uncharacterized protein (PEP-CTERM system associated)